jgi:hypothetical protein
MEPILGKKEMSIYKISLNIPGILAIISAIVIGGIILMFTWDYVYGQNIDCPDELNTSNFTQNVWDKYCMETKTDSDYAGISPPSYMKGNNTIANVTAIHDFNNETLYDKKNNPLRIVQPHPEMEFHEIDWNCRLYGECVNSTNVTKSSPVIECPRTFNEQTMKAYYECMGGAPVGYYSSNNNLSGGVQ